MTRIICNGVFDVLHFGHFELLNTAKIFPSYFLLVLIDSDKRVKQLKGSDRPYHNQYQRKSNLESLKVVHKVEVFNSDQELNDMIKDYQPHFMLKGSDYEGRPIIGSEHVIDRILFVPHTKHSTTEIVEKKYL